MVWPKPGGDKISFSAIRLIGRTVETRWLELVGLSLVEVVCRLSLASFVSMPAIRRGISSLLAKMDWTVVLRLFIADWISLTEVLNR